MNEYLQGVFDTTATTTISMKSFLICIGAALCIGVFLAFAYAYKSRHTASFLLTMGLLPAIVCVVIMMVNGNLGAGVAVAGAFSLVRFRSVPGTAKEIAAIFLAMAAGLICGMGYIGYAALFSGILGICMIIFSLVSAKSSGASKRTLVITVPENLDFADAFDEILDRYTTSRELYEVKSTNMGSLFKLTYHIGLGSEGRTKEFLDELRTRNGNLDISLVRGTENAEVL